MVRGMQLQHPEWWDGPEKIYGHYITAESLEVVKQNAGSNLQELVMTEFWIEDDKDAIKTKPSYPECCCKQQASPHSPAARGFVSQEVERIQGPLEELGLTTFM